MADWQINDAVGLFGATSLVGACLLPLLKQSAIPVRAYTRQAARPAEEGIEWQQLQSASSLQRYREGDSEIPLWICAAPIWVLPDYFDLLVSYGVRRIVVVSSTSRFTKNTSTDRHDQAVAHRLAQAEESVQQWAQCNQVEWIILRPTLIYGLNRDKNIAEIARFIRRFAFFPVFGQAQGLRQPLHVADLAKACLLALGTKGVTNRPYDISGGETLTYRAMVRRIFLRMDRTPRLITIPLWMFSAALYLLNRIPRYQNWSVGMAERMNQDMVFDNSDAIRDFGFSPRNFLISDKGMSDVGDNLSW
ncbi:NAD-dependent epimerase/dehydratase family protein [Actimicrobium sp. CCI2.3]|uniref:NAD-dependent epimerase/dehydratase family protein n=1 Tax=Actimicrobium sp. CCI2.3 TaxID=3048616 RepID=UPI002AB3A895|nr:NAD-dependent epimerase/dehydratase family protein [Actimicrobium sp. CCI2.3]MDY7576118.1 NAD-dependent epimerase/dehydratase family protein [Actimicrobium sp. CCI2.3]MEB0023479.1 NAD-dependent epimerase/dehydratase family protein [Actimicrobium sp. CCI2.3]